MVSSLGYKACKVHPLDSVVAGYLARRREPAAVEWSDAWRVVVAEA